MGRPYQPFGVAANRRVEVGVEHSSTGLGSDFSFTRLRLALDGHFKTFLKRRITPNALDVRLVAGYSIGDVPVQRFGSLEASMGFFSPFGAFRTVTRSSLRGRALRGSILGAQLQKPRPLNYWGCGIGLGGVRGW